MRDGGSTEEDSAGGREGGRHGGRQGENKAGRQAGRQAGSREAGRQAAGRQAERQERRWGAGREIRREKRDGEKRTEEQEIETRSVSGTDGASESDNNYDTDGQSRRDVPIETQGDRRGYLRPPSLSFSRSLPLTAFLSLSLPPSPPLFTPPHYISLLSFLPPSSSPFPLFSPSPSPPRSISFPSKIAMLCTGADQGPAASRRGHGGWPSTACGLGQPLEDRVSLNLRSTST